MQGLKKQPCILQLPIAVIRTEINTLRGAACDKVLNYKACQDSSLMSTHFITAFDKQDFQTAAAEKWLRCGAYKDSHPRGCSPQVIAPP